MRVDSRSSRICPASAAGAPGLRELPIFCFEEPDGAFYYGFPDLGTGCKIARHHGESDIAQLRGFLQRRLRQANRALNARLECFCRHPRQTR